MGLDMPSKDNGSTNGSVGKAYVPEPRVDEAIEAATMLSVGDGEPIPFASKKRNADFHELFPEIPKEELLVDDATCAWQKEVLVQGRMYLSERHINFYASILGWVHSISIPFAEVQSVERKNVAAIIPNALEITTKSSKYFFASFLSREISYEMIYKLWLGVPKQTIQMRTIRKGGEMSAWREIKPPSRTRYSSEDDFEYESGSNASEEPAEERGRRRLSPSVERDDEGRRGLSLDSSMRLEKSESSDELGSLNALHVIDEDGTGSGEERGVKEGSDGLQGVVIPIIRSRSAPDPGSPKRGVTPPQREHVGGDGADVMSRRQFARLPPGSDTPLKPVGLGELAREAVVVGRSVRERDGEGAGSGGGSPGSARSGSPAGSPRRETNDGGELSPGRTLIVHQKHPVVLRNGDVTPRRSVVSESGAGEEVNKSDENGSAPDTVPSRPRTPSPPTSTDTAPPTYEKPLPPTPKEPVPEPPTADTSTEVQAPPTNPPKRLRKKPSKPSKPPLPKPTRTASLPPALCPCEKDHASLTPVLDKEFDIPLLKLWELLYGRESFCREVKFLRGFLERKRKVKDMKMCDWVEGGRELRDPEGLVKEGDGEAVGYVGLEKGWHRKVEYVVPLTNPLGGGDARRAERERVRGASAVMFDAREGEREDEGEGWM
ncbi:hypothetical protein HDV00_007606 [Rhizophlyctis rosea]|nr:hypothetical protein HDV00_007606 [Rhizophlyctis rosea]